MSEILENIKGILDNLRVVKETELTNQDKEADLELTATVQFEEIWGLPSSVQSAICKRNDGCIIDVEMRSPEDHIMRIWIQER